MGHRLAGLQPDHVSAPVVEGAGGQGGARQPSAPSGQLLVAGVDGGLPEREQARRVRDGQGKVVTLRGESPLQGRPRVRDPAELEQQPTAPEVPAGRNPRLVIASRGYEARGYDGEAFVEAPRG